MEKQFFRPKEAAALIGVSVGSFWNYVRAGKLITTKPSEKVTLVSRDALMAFAGGTK
jgi:predicted site-specific integrase-resolvase